MHARVVCKLGVEGGRQHVTLPDGNRPAIVEAGDYPDALANGVYNRSADEHRMVRRAVHVFDFEVSLEAVNLSSEGVAADLDIHEFEGVGAVI